MEEEFYPLAGFVKFTECIIRVVLYCNERVASFPFAEVRINFFLIFVFCMDLVSDFLARGKNGFLFECSPQNYVGSFVYFKRAEYYPIDYNVSILKFFAYLYYIVLASGTVWFKIYGVRISFVSENPVGFGEIAQVFIDFHAVDAHYSFFKINFKVSREFFEYG